MKLNFSKLRIAELDRKPGIALSMITVVITVFLTVAMYLTITYGLSMILVFPVIAFLVLLFHIYESR